MGSVPDFHMRKAPVQNVIKLFFNYFPLMETVEVLFSSIENAMIRVKSINNFVDEIIAFESIIEVNDAAQKAINDCPEAEACIELEITEKALEDCFTAIKPCLEHYDTSKGIATICPASLASCNEFLISIHLNYNTYDIESAGLCNEAILDCLND